MKNLLAVLMIVFLCFSSALATTYYVSPDGCDDAPGTSWGNAFETLTYALSQASSDDEIWVAAGTYTPGTTRSSTFQMVSGVDVFGGFNGTETTRSQRDWVNNETILSGDIGTESHTDNCYHVVTGGVSNASLDGFTITKGYADGTAPNCLGAGLFNPMDVYNCIFDDNYASGNGGAAWLYDNCEIINCIFRNNSTDGAGGAAHLYMANVTFENNLFYNNSANNGGALYINYSNPSIVNCTFTQNNVDNAGGALYFAFCSTSVAVENCILWGNSADGSGDEAFNYFAGIAPTYSYCDIQNCFDGANWVTSLGTNGGNNIESDPIFVDTESNDFHLTGDSPCLDAADNTAITASDDLNWRTRTVDGPDAGDTATVDMGCYEHHIIYVDTDVSTGDNDGSSWANAYDNIQDAIDAAQSGDEIWVADGTYTLTATITVNKEASIYGGFQGNSRSGGGETSRSQRNFRTYETIVDGDDSRRCFYVTADATIDGFNIIDGAASLGGGMCCYSCDPTIENCVFENNAAIGEWSCGGGLAIKWDSAPKVISCSFINNSAVDAGGGLLITGEKRNTTHGCSPIIVNCLFVGCSAEDGGAITNHYGSNSTIVNCTLYSNSAIYGGAIYNDLSSPTLTNCILWNNTASSRGSQIDDYWDGNSIVTYSDIQGGWSGTGNINSNPIFTNGYFTLASSSSPCVDTGHNTEISGYDYDLAGNTRVVDGDESGPPAEVDMGSYEYQP